MKRLHVFSFLLLAAIAITAAAQVRVSPRAPGDARDATTQPVAAYRPEVRDPPPTRIVAYEAVWVGPSLEQADPLTATVQAMIDRGWQPYGPLVADRSLRWFVQPMVRYE